MGLTSKQRRAALEKGLSVDLSADEPKYNNPNPHAALRLFARPSAPAEQSALLPADGRPEALPADREVHQTVDRKHYRQTVCQSYRQTPPSRETQIATPLPADRQTEVQEKTEADGIPLAPIQWAVLQILQKADAAAETVSYRKLAQAANASIRGVRDALAVIEQEGGLRSKVTIRTPDVQGLRIELDPGLRFRPSTLRETKGLLKRGANYRQTVDRKSPALPADGLRLSVCINNNTKQTDVGDLLHILPPTWKIRERTLIEIACAFPAMTTLEFRRSLMHLVEQTRQSRQPIRNHNAWIKAAFAKNEGPLVTERMIEAQLDHITRTGQGRAVQHEHDDGVPAEFDILQRYLTADPEDKAAIDQAAREKAAPALRIASVEKHGGIMEHALLECAREFFAKDAKQS